MHNELEEGTAPWWVRLGAQGASSSPHPLCRMAERAGWGLQGTGLKGLGVGVAASREGKSQAPFDSPHLPKTFWQGRQKVIPHRSWSWVGRLRQAATRAGETGRGGGDVISGETSRPKLKPKKRKGAI